MEGVPSLAVAAVLAEVSLDQWRVLLLREWSIVR